MTTWRGVQLTYAHLNSKGTLWNPGLRFQIMSLVSASTHHLKITHWKQKGEKLAHRVDDVIEACNPRPGPRGPPAQAFHDNNTCFRCMNLSGFAVHWIVFGFRRVSPVKTFRGSELPLHQPCLKRNIIIDTFIDVVRHELDVIAAIPQSSCKRVTRNISIYLGSCLSTITVIFFWSFALTL